MRKFAVVVGLVLVAAFSASAQDTSRLQVDGGFLYGRALTNQPEGADNCYGGYGNATYFFVGGLGVTANFGGCGFSPLPSSGDKASTFEYVFGPTYAFRSSKWTEPFVQALFGGDSASLSEYLISGISITPVTYSYNGFAMNLGGGLDVRVTDMVAIRVFQVNYLYGHIAGANLNGIELKFGVTLRLFSK